MLKNLIVLVIILRPSWAINSAASFPQIITIILIREIKSTGPHAHPHPPSHASMMNFLLHRTLRSFNHSTTTRPGTLCGKFNGKRPSESGNVAEVHQNVELVFISFIFFISFVLFWIRKVCVWVSVELQTPSCTNCRQLRTFGRN